MQINKNKQVCVQLPTYADNVALPAFARRCCSNLMPAAPQQQTCSSAFAAAGPCWDRQTGGHGTVFTMRGQCKKVIRILSSISAPQIQPSG